MSSTSNQQDILDDLDEQMEALRKKLEDNVIAMKRRCRAEGTFDPEALSDELQGYAVEVYTEMDKLFRVKGEEVDGYVDESLCTCGFSDDEEEKEESTEFQELMTEDEEKTIEAKESTNSEKAVEVKDEESKESADSVVPVETSGSLESKFTNSCALA